MLRPIMLKAYYRLTKPGIIYGNIFTATAGFLLGSGGDVHFIRLLGALAGMALVIAAGCVINNYIDRDIDAKMARTKKRALVSGKITGPQALVYAGVLGIAGFAILATQTNVLTLCIGVIGFIDYVVFYTWSKRHTTYATLVGSISGATPIAAGYTAASNTFDAGALLVFLVLVLWQMPHFYAIAMYRIKDYRAAGIPVLPLKQGIRHAKVHMLVYVQTFIVAAVSLTMFGYTGLVYTLVVLFVGFMWLRLALAGLRTQKNELWARAMFRYSLIALLAVCIAIGFDALLP